MAIELMQISRSVIGLKAETSPGVFNAPVAADMNMRLYGEPDYQVDPELHDIVEVKQDFSTQPALVGGIRSNISFRTMLTGAGVAGAPETVPAWQKGLIACGMQSTGEVQSCTCASPSGPLIAGEVITSSEGGTAVYIEIDGTVLLIHTAAGSMGTSGTFTGGTSGNTVAYATAPATFGLGTRPDSTISTYSVGLYSPYGAGALATNQKTRGARGNWNMAVDGVGAPCYVDCQMFGAYQAQAKETSMPSPTYQIARALGFKGVGLDLSGDAVAASSAIKLKGITLAANLDTTTPGNANEADGLLGWTYQTGRQFIGGFNPLLVDIDTKDFQADFVAGNTAKLRFTMGSVATHRILVIMPKIAYRGYGNEAQDGLRALALPFGAHSDGYGAIADNEIYIISY